MNHVRLQLISSIFLIKGRLTNLCIREAYYINKCKPELNSKEENSIDLILF